MLEAVKYIVENLGATVNRKDRWGNTPIDDAMRGGFEGVAAYLESRGAERSSGVLDPATELCQAAAQGNEDKLRHLIQEKEYNVNAGDYDRRTAMHLAASEVRRCSV